MRQYRDLTVIPLNGNEQLVIACDSSAGIGNKPADSVRADPAVTAAFCLRVPLIELLAIGAEPIAVIDLIGNEYEETGRQMLAGVKNELTKAGFSDIPLNGSTEENVATAMSTIGITVIGKAKTGQLKFGCLKTGDKLFYLGQPYVGTEVIANLDTIFGYSLLRELQAEEGLKELLPVGSKGILYEASVLADSSNLILDYELSESQGAVLNQSAGPATVLIVAVAPSYSNVIAEKYQLTYIGAVTAKEESR